MPDKLGFGQMNLNKNGLGKRKIKKAPANGFTMIEALMALLIASIFASILFVQVRTAHQALHLPLDDQEQFAILQIREMVSLSKIAQVQNDQLILEEHERQETLQLDKNRLVKKPGYEILMEHIDAIEFFTQNGKLYLRYSKQGHVKEFQIG
ncbi:prepilin-type N-terminal cleavage/methylation domain-containing protein [Allobaculum sp. JKK-2023]|uniref:prepilin-type N-terminal cleavage/methylation domain-containing protein n=1 Tax=Allobaculum sp. JKK-2023 TaxID=3108943 RepID=UPI002B05C283|nr:prepilin-type N-terminal cleavage/methylation domain-containing protein [Allobaculum sp. JKK-2023]